MVSQVFLFREQLLLLQLQLQLLLLLSCKSISSLRAIMRLHTFACLRVESTATSPMYCCCCYCCYLDIAHVRLDAKALGVVDRACAAADAYKGVAIITTSRFLLQVLPGSDYYCKYDQTARLCCA